MPMSSAASRSSDVALNARPSLVRLRKSCNAAMTTIESRNTSRYPLLVFLLSIVVIAALQLFLNRTKLGRAFRATSDDREAAELMGINNRHIYGLAMAIALAIVALAGTLLAARTTFDPTQGSFRLIYAFEAVIMGGMGSIWGTLIGAIVLGVSQTLGSQAFGL